MKKCYDPHPLFLDLSFHLCTFPGKKKWKVTREINQYHEFTSYYTLALQICFSLFTEAVPIQSPLPGIPSVVLPSSADDFELLSFGAI